MSKKERMYSINIKKLIFFTTVSIFSIIISHNSFAKDNEYEVVSKPIELKIFNKVFTSKSSVDNFLNNTNLDSNTLNDLGLIKTEKGYQVIEGGKYYQTFYLKSQNQSGYFFAVLFLFIVICLLVLLCLYIVFRFKWKKLDENKLVTFPKEAVKIMNTFLKEHVFFKEETKKHLNSVISDLAKVIEEQNRKLDNLDEQLNAIKELAEERGSELKRYKEGYDYSKLKSLILGIINNIKNIEKYLSNQEIKGSALNKYLEATKNRLDLLLQSNGVEVYIPETGKLISNVDGCRAVETENTYDEKLVNVISRIIQNGYKISIDNTNSKIIKEAEVIVYSKDEKNLKTNKKGSQAS